MGVQVKHDEAKKRFETETHAGLAVANYERDGSTVTFTHTVVPEEAEGQGIATALVQAALDWARSQQLRVIPQCPYVASFVRRHSEYSDLVDHAAGGDEE